MRPTKLRFCGINSFSERQEIDFEKLTANGLFGIFGDTGSGKSTILDCINFALFGDVDRSKKKIDVINYNCEQAEVEFEFVLLSEGKRKHFKVERSIKKKSGLGKAMLYEGEGENCVCVADNTSSVNKRIEEILGLSAEDFRKCIALPQGEFAQFVQCAPAERFKLIERLFSLSRYGDGLKERLAIKESEVEAQYSAVAATLATYEGVDAEVLENCKNKLNDDKNELENLEKRYKTSKIHADKLVRLLQEKQEFSQIKQEYADHLKRAEEMAELRKTLAVAPLCKTVCGLENELRDATLKKQVAGDGVVKYKAKIKEVSGQIEEIKRSVEAKNYEKNLELLNGKLALYEATASDISELEAGDMKLQTLRAKFSTAALTADKLREKELYAQKSVQAAKAAYENCKGEDLLSALENKLKPAVLREEYAEQLAYLSELRENVSDYDKTSELYKYIIAQLDERLVHYKGLVSDSDLQETDLKKVITELKYQSDLREKLLRDYDNKKEIYADCKQKSALAESEVNSLKANGEEQRALVVKIKSRLEKVFGEDVKDCNGAIKRLKEAIASLKREQEAAQNLLENKKNYAESVKLEVEKTKERLKNSLEEIAALEIKLNSAIKESGLNGVDECKNILNRVEKYADAEGELNAYAEREIALKTKIAEFENNKELIAFDEVDAHRAVEECDKLNAEVKDKHADVKLGESRVAELSERLEKKKSTEKELKTVNSKRELVYQLKELTRGNRFLEYIAREYLSDISKAASDTLLKLSGGRYYLCYTDNFYVCDNYNEGNKRGVNTLSGGETFLVSLSLALALSAEICRSSMKNLEFFFLDEGFGTLDESLVDTVMDCLEKLRSANFTIGIISHVEELKHRIESKILVNKATETHGSTVQVIA